MHDSKFEAVKPIIGGLFHADSLEDNNYETEMASIADTIDPHYRKLLIEFLDYTLNDKRNRENFNEILGKAGSDIVFAKPFLNTLDRWHRQLIYRDRAG